MKKILLLLITGIHLLSHAQQKLDVAPSSPEVASFNKYLDMPIGTSTGIPSVGIPIYSVQEGDISIPISLSYHSGGVRVEEISSWVGLGWSVNAGGMVSRSVRGIPDDLASIGYMYTSNKVTDATTGTASQRLQKLIDAYGGFNDYEPDVFNFSFMGYSGKFFYNQNTGEFFQAPFSNIKIEAVKSGGVTISGWVFTTPDGFVYHFGSSADGLRTGVENTDDIFNISYDETNGYGTATTSRDYMSSWMLMDITSPKGNQVNFTYQIQTEVRLISKGGESSIPDVDCEDLSHSITITDRKMSTPQIKTINFDTGSVEFVLNTTLRTDLQNAKSLSKIQIFNSDNTLLKYFDLTYSYFTSISEVYQDWHFEVNQVEPKSFREKRLILDSIKEFGSLGNAKKPYAFEYDSQQLPSRFSNAQDYWGYYNGKLGNVNLIPDVEYPRGVATIYNNGSERTVDIVKCLAGSLKKITYPTGGSIEYFFESNKVNKNDIITKGTLGYNLRNRLVKNDEEFHMDQTSEYTTNYQNPNNLNQYTGPNSPWYQHTKTFTIPTNVLGWLRVDVNSVTGCDPNDPLAPCDYSFEVKGITNTNFNVQLSVELGHSDNKFKIPPGTYQLVANCTRNGLAASYDFELEYEYGTDPHLDHIVVGGLRINKIKLNDGSGNIIEKKYSYDDILGVTTGYMISSPVFIQEETINICGFPVGFETSIKSISQVDTDNSNGNILGYKRVTETENGKGKIINYFSSNVGFPFLENENVFLPLVYDNWNRGNLIRKEIYKEETGNYSIIKKETYSYEKDLSTELILSGDFGLKYKKSVGGDVSVFGDNPSTWEYVFYKGYSVWHRLKETETTDYLDGLEVKSKTTHFFDNNELLPSQSESTNSKGETILTKTRYPDDIKTDTTLEDNSTIKGGTLTTSEFDAVDAMKSDNLHQMGIPIQIESYKKVSGTEILLSIQRSNFDEWQTDLILLESVESSKGTGSLEDQIVYHDYYTDGNPKEVSKADGTHIVYIWGYNEQYPIAKIENSEFSDIPTINYNDVIAKSDLDVDATTEETLRTVLTALRNSLPDAMVTTYTYDPLIGVTSITDPRGQTIYYQYDAFNRLEYVKDQDDNIISKNQYHYKTQ